MEKFEQVVIDMPKGKTIAMLETREIKSKKGKSWVVYGVYLHLLNKIFLLNLGTQPNRYVEKFKRHHCNIPKWMKKHAEYTIY